MLALFRIRAGVFICLALSSKILFSIKSQIRTSAEAMTMPICGANIKLGIEDSIAAEIQRMKTAMNGRKNS